LQIDGHTRFEYNWDQELIDSLESFKEIGFNKPVFTMYPGTYIYNNNLKEVVNYSIDTTSTAFRDKPEMFMTELIPNQMAVSPERGNLQRAVAAGFVFTTGDYSQLGFNEKIMFMGEEILLAASLFTNGYDLLIPDKHYIYHLYYDNTAVFQKNLRRHVWKDFPAEFTKKDAISKAEVLDIFTHKRTGPGALGTEKTLEEYGIYAGLDFVNRVIINDGESNV
jgi:hypothetical protein